MEYALWLY